MLLLWKLAISQTKVKQVAKRESIIYPPEIIKKWLETSFIQHNSKHSFEITMGNMCRGTTCNGQYLTHAEYNNVLFDQYKKIEKLIDPLTWFGIELQRLGSCCSVTICLATAIYIVYSCIALIVRILLLQRTGIKVWSTLARACCSVCYLISMNQAEPNQQQAA